MSRKNDKVVSGENDWARRKNGSDGFVCGYIKRNDTHDESFRHCGCLDCRRQRNREINM